jgi:hypothetical protein
MEKSPRHRTDQWASDFAAERRYRLVQVPTVDADNKILYLIGVNLTHGRDRSVQSRKIAPVNRPSASL